MCPGPTTYSHNNNNIGTYLEPPLCFPGARCLTNSTGLITGLHRVGPQNPGAAVDVMVGEKSDN